MNDDAPDFWENPFAWLRQAIEDAWSFWDDPIGKLQSAARDTVAFFEQLFSSFSLGDWVLIGLAGVAIYWVVASLKSLTTLGPIEVEQLEHDADPKAAVLELTAALRERLASTGLSTHRRQCPPGPRRPI